jgi:teichuronic acid biosynthesis glycosyltransferase TuaG
MALVSVIMPNFNGAKYIESAIASVRAQSERDWQLLIADDGSSDNSPDIVATISAVDPRVKLVGGGSREGPARARNRAISAADGRYLAFLDSDDVWAPEKLALQLELQRYHGCAVTFTGIHKMDAFGQLERRVIPPRSTVSYRELLNRNYLPCSSVIVDREHVGDIRMPDILRRQDYALWLEILRRTGELAYARTEPLLHYRMYPGSFSASKLVGALYHWKVLRDLEKLGPVSASGHFAMYALQSGGEYLRARLSLPVNPRHFLRLSNKRTGNYSADDK